MFNGTIFIQIKIKKVVGRYVCNNAGNVKGRKIKATRTQIRIIDNFAQSSPNHFQQTKSRFIRISIPPFSAFFFDIPSSLLFARECILLNQEQPNFYPSESGRL